MLSHCSFVILLTLHSLLLHYFCLIFSLLMKYSAFGLHFPFYTCLLLPHSETSEHKFMSISGTELTVHCQPTIQIQSECCHLKRTSVFPWQSRTQMVIFQRNKVLFIFLFLISQYFTHSYITRCKREDGGLYNINKTF